MPHLSRKARALFLKSSIFLLCISAILVLAGYFRDRAGKPEYNVLIYCMTPLRSDTLGCYGSPDALTPSIDDFANRSAVFRNAHTQETFTLPALATLLTSVYPVFHKIFQFERAPRLDKNLATLPQILASRGYRTVLVDPYRYLDWEDGFSGGFNDKIYSGLDSMDAIDSWLSRNTGSRFFMFLIDMQTHPPYTPSEASILKVAGKTENPPVHSREYLENKSLDIVTRNPEILFTEKTLKKYSDIFGLKDHDLKAGKIRALIDELGTPGIFQGTEDMVMEFESLVTLVFLNSFDMFFEKFKEERPDVYDSFTGGKHPLSTYHSTGYLRTLYNAKAYEADRCFGDFIEVLKKRGLMKNTVIIFLSCHGEEFMEHGEYGHALMYENVSRIPLIIYTPRAAFGKRTISSHAALIDVMPTVLDLTGIPSPHYLQGISLLAPMKGGNVPPGLEDRAVYTEHLMQYMDSTIHYSYSLIFRGYKYIAEFIGRNGKLVFISGRENLFNLENDPYEKSDMAGLDPGKALEMKKKLLNDFRKNSEKMRGVTGPLFKLNDN
ncbi:MAG: sulfatase-like hydrolase/transferase [Elusimicrobia bacterium]|nr:sulfatase-like hydrolase/transferase [Elusimicrobiota bacterium]